MQIQMLCCSAQCFSGNLQRILNLTEKDLVTQPEMGNHQYESFRYDSSENIRLEMTKRHNVGRQRSSDLKKIFVRQDEEVF